MTPTREDLIQLLTKEAQVGIAALVEQFACTAAEVLVVLGRHADFERCPPRPQDKPGFAWRLSSMAADLRVRAAAMTHQRAIEQPPQRRQYAHDTGAARAEFKSQDESANVLLTWLRHNPGQWSLVQIATARGCSIPTVRGHVKAHRPLLHIERQPGKGKALLVSLKPAPAT